MEIGRYLYFVDNLTSVPPGSNGYHHLGKVRPVLDALSGQFTTLYNLNRGCSTDEAIISFKGWNSLNKNILKKTIKQWIQGIDKGRYQEWFVPRFQVCVSKKKEAENGLGASVVKNLTRTIVGKIIMSTVTIFSQDFRIFKIFYMTKSMPVELYALTGNSFQSNQNQSIKKFQTNRRLHGTREWKLSNCTVANHKNLYRYFSTKLNRYGKIKAKNGEV